MKTAIFSATLLASTLATAATPIDGWYGSVFGGYTHLSNFVDSSTYLRRFDRSINTNFIDFNTFNSSTFDNRNNFGSAIPRNGFNSGFRLGFQSNALRYEGEFTYIGAVINQSSGRRDRYPFLYNQVNQFNPFVPFQEYEHKRKSSTNAVFGMANVYFDFPTTIPCISPFLGVGLGYGWIETNLNLENSYYFNSFNFSQNLDFRNDFRTSDSAFSYQATAGLTFNYVENWALNVAYRYIGTTKLKNFGRVFQGNLVSVGLVYRFNEYNYK
ncbi:MAG: porin family protein [Tatlockia sp.]|nr:porin family protein [Tatlockia sp.]